MSAPTSGPTLFGLTGVSGYIAPRHLKAIKDTGNVLTAALDPFDSVGIMDSFFPDAEFFTQPEIFERYLYDARRQGQGVDYVGICSPNYLHDAHIRMALRAGADALCEKPIVLNPEDITALKEVEEETGRRVWTILQLRAHAALEKVKAELSPSSGDKYDVDLSYMTSRGTWYLRSWKGRTDESGGLATNIGVHFFDMLSWLFGDIEHVEVHQRSETVCAGYLELERARVRWFLSIDPSYLPEEQIAKGQRTYRSITIDGQEVEFSEGFTDLHTEVYRRTLAGQGFSLDDTYQAIATVAQIRKQPVVSAAPDTRHRFLRG
ncbi:Gfo/Idh/MocA family oxidoreductase [Deinococcus radiopugnans]|uniref:Gfo/Idh/MocA family oxidoreductase n=1 Tax=Deinococcus radiopugnans ATCC 19172 TaxID=585398 RepID=A0A5C4Y7B8_9DEIO|nr:Gfo/Idh/MocA family oxidoreductase [Deinococcus radiopugnans]MBB6017755.1 UDP-N-acetyl-2-amino-2-deoxyglucuronate dehydrogenase [Deinococcus radiopugnans ATCC 19172]TNM71440.1 Gfo/Idh/MocA family oxidoreductase [Deinococcus radiopugnans ATCC 19172]